MDALGSRVALVTGASRGIGAAIARRLAADGVAVAAMARTMDPDPRYSGSLTETVERIARAGGHAVPIRGDLSSAEDRRRIVAEAEQALGPIDILVNNAAVTFLQPVLDFPEKRYRLMFELQVRAPFELTQLVLPGMYERGRGWILNISSRSAINPEGPPFEQLMERGFTVYGMCKAALERFSTGLAAESASRGVRVNALAPWGNVPTPGAGTHDLVEDFTLEDESVIAEAAHALVSGDLTGRIAYSAHLLAELGRTPALA